MRLNPYDPDLFDTDAFGNGTSDVIRRNLYVSAVERVLATRQQALGGGADALPTLDMARCLEEEFQECENSHAAHLAYHDLEPCDAGLASLLGPFRSERRVAGRVMDFRFWILPTGHSCASRERLAPGSPTLGMDRGGPSPGRTLRRALPPPWGRRTTKLR